MDEARGPHVTDMPLEEYEKLDPIARVEWGGKRIVFATPNRFTYWRVETLPSKEPDTLRWIAEFGPGDVLLDVGANVGMYTVWAAATRGTRVFAFEPESQNFALLNRNIQLNRLDDLVRAYAIALSDEGGFGPLHLSKFAPGESCHSFGEMLNFRLEPLTSVFTQGCFATTIDGVIASGEMPVPSHIKIDVDGIEHKVLAGARNTFDDLAVKSVLVEINTNIEPHRRIIGDLSDLGFSFSPDEARAALRKEGPFAGVGTTYFAYKAGGATQRGMGHRKR